MIIGSPVAAKDGEGGFGTTYLESLRPNRFLLRDTIPLLDLHSFILALE